MGLLPNDVFGNFTSKYPGYFDDILRKVPFGNSPIMRPNIKGEIPHSELNKESGNSARYTKIDTIQQVQLKDSNGTVQNIPFRLKDKVIYEINLCPCCGSQNTFHYLIQQNGDITGNVW